MNKKYQNLIFCFCFFHAAIQLEIVEKKVSFLPMLLVLNRGIMYVDSACFYRVLSCVRCPSVKPNSSGQFFKLYCGIVGFSNVLF